MAPDSSPPSVDARERAKIPDTFPICHDEYHAKYVGRTADGRQFFITTPFVPHGRNFVATFLFDDAGVLVGDRIEEVGPRPDLRVPPGNVDHRVVGDQLEAHLAALGEVTFEDIEVAPFEITRFGIAFGLIPNIYEPEGPDEEPYSFVELHPGDYMAFSYPWNGDYET
jgi:hypothetical protein